MKSSERTAAIIAVCNELRSSAIRCVAMADIIVQNAQRPPADLQILEGSLKAKIDDMQTQLHKLREAVNVSLED